METLKLKVNCRTDMSKGRRNAIRREGSTTASISGHDSESVSVEVNVSELLGLIKQSENGIKSLFDLDIVGAPKKLSGIVIIKDIYKDPLTKKLIEITFQRVSMKEKSHVGVPIVMVGKPEALLAEGGMIEQTMEELQVLCLPSDTPRNIEVDVSGLVAGEHIRVSDVVLPDGVEALGPQDATIVVSKPPSVRRDKVEEAEAETAAE